MHRRTALLTAASAAATTTLGLVACKAPSGQSPTASGDPPAGPLRSALVDPVLAVAPLGRGQIWQTPDPFLFCAHHDDSYPEGNAQLGPAASLRGREIGSDFAMNEAWRMYHGGTVPGFPQHPHRGFETVTVVRRGLIDHADSLGAAARYGRGDVQWLTAGQGIVHAEMFPLLDDHGPNPLELFQIWLNLPSTDKMVKPHFTMLWGPQIPRYAAVDEAGKSTEVTIIAGAIGPMRAPSPPPSSWASRSDTDVAIWTLALAPGARFTLPKARAGSNRRLYFFDGKTLRVGPTTDVAVGHHIDLLADVETVLHNGDTAAQILMLQGRPIAEPIARRGPFVMNTQAEIQKAYADYQATQFGGWPWPKNDPVHDRQERFARHADGHVEKGT
jgi:quercetin 2,3-dioxygenase